MPSVNQRDFEDFFREAGINFSKPGFYDEQAFIRIEKTNSSFLQIYADYIESMTFSSKYLRKAKSIAVEVAEFIYDKLSRDGLKGACLDVCGIVSRFLERQGVWNYVIKGGLTIVFDKGTGFDTLHCAPIMTHDNPATLGHAWVVAPPFKVIDVAFSCQHFACGEERHLQGFIAEEAVNSATPQIEDLLDMDSIRLHLIQHGRPPTLNDIEMVDPELMERIHNFGTFEVRVPRATLKYVSCAVSFCEAPLEEVKNIKLLGKSPVELYEEFLIGRKSVSNGEN